METNEITLSTTSREPSNRQSVSLWNLSERQKSEIRRFKTLYPYESDVLGKFSPSNWARAVENQEKCYSAPCVMLKHLDSVYNHNGLAKLVVKNNMIGVYSASSATYQYKDDVMNMVADMFIAKFGGELNLYAMMLYFANYLLEYKGTYKEFDMQDVLQQCGKKFLPWWRSKVQSYQPQNDDEKEKYQLKGRDAKIWMIAQRIKEGQTVEEIKRCSLYKYGWLTDEEIEQAKQLAIETF